MTADALRNPEWQVGRCNANMRYVGVRWCGCPMCTGKEKRRFTQRAQRRAVHAALAPGKAYDEDWWDAVLFARSRRVWRARPE